MTERLAVSCSSKWVISLGMLLSIAIVGTNQWLKYRDGAQEYSSWTVDSIKSGDSFAVSRNGKAKTIKLCGVIASSAQAKDFLASIINLGNGTVDIQQVGNYYEAWILIAPDYDTELVQHVSTKPNELIEQSIHLNTWIIERGYAKRDTQTALRCLQPENLAWAEALAREEKLGIWHKNQAIATIKNSKNEKFCE